ncbi:hypothetical protein D6D25_07897 [Aureobasidium pullulans]|nr:hypothetical protein D6D25_07897 [Aureobasidium pullulans]
MGQTKSEQAPVVGRAHVNNGAPKGREDLEPAFRNNLTGRRKQKRYKSKDGYHLVVHGGADRNAGIKTEPAPDQRETFDDARRGKATEIQSLPQNRKRAASWDNNHQISAKTNNKKGCPVCRECGGFHRSACKWLVCKKCSVKHHPEVPCNDAEARLKRRLEEEESKQAQRFLEEEDRMRARPSASRNKKANIAKKWSHAALGPSPMKQIEQANYTDPTSSAAPLPIPAPIFQPIAAPVVQPASNFPFAGDISWFIDSNNIIRFGSAPPPPMPQQQNGQVYPPAPKPMEMASPGITQSELVSILSRIGSSPYPSAVKLYLEENIDALLEEAEINARTNRAVVVEREDGENGEPPSYFEWRRRGGRQ